MLRIEEDGGGVKTIFPHSILRGIRNTEFSRSGWISRSESNRELRIYSRHKKAAHQAALKWWAMQGSNLRPLPCEGSGLCIKALKTLIQGNSCLDLSVFLEANTPVSLCWDAKLDAFTGSQSFTMFPKIVINGELYEAPFKHDFKLPVNGFAGLEGAFTPDRLRI